MYAKKCRDKKKLERENKKVYLQKLLEKNKILKEELEKLEKLTMLYF